MISLSNYDQALYEYFNNRLDEKIAAYGESRMARDVARLRALNQQLYDKCVVQDTASSGFVKLDKDMRPYNGDTVAYSIRYPQQNKEVNKKHYNINFTTVGKMSLVAIWQL